MIDFETSDFKSHFISTRTGFCWPELFRKLRERHWKPIPEAMTRCSRCRRHNQGAGRCHCETSSRTDGYAYAPELLTGRRKRVRPQEGGAHVLPIANAAKKRSAR
jgi:hypothetical protein